MEPSFETKSGTPGVVLRKLFMDPLGLSAYKLALDLQVPPIAVSQILRGKRAISINMALRLGRYFGVAPDFWMAIQAAEDLAETAKVLPDLETVQRCEALEGRAFLIREGLVGGVKNWQVLLATGKAGTVSAAPKATRREATTTPAGGAPPPAKTPAPPKRSASGDGTAGKEASARRLVAR
jgi:addiction module HigA family antidote